MADVCIPITFSALYQRLNRHLRKEHAILRRARGRYAHAQLGQWYVFDARQNTVPRHHVDPVTLARELGLLKAWETVTEE